MYTESDLDRKRQEADELLKDIDFGAIKSTVTAGLLILTLSYQSYSVYIFLLCCIGTSGNDVHMTLHLTITIY